MIQLEHTVRVPYDEVDKMGYLYHGNYTKYFHVARTELLRVKFHKVVNENLFLFRL